MTTIPKAVERGAAFLDEKRPGWDEKIDLDRLNLSSGCDCVIGQLHPRAAEPYHYGIKLLGFKEWDTKAATKYGFNTFEGGFEGFPRLTQAWRTLIERRREAA